MPVDMILVTVGNPSEWVHRYLATPWLNRSLGVVEYTTMLDSASAIHEIENSFGEANDATVVVVDTGEVDLVLIDRFMKDLDGFIRERSFHGRFTKLLFVNLGRSKPLYFDARVPQVSLCNEDESTTKERLGRIHRMMGVDESIIKEITQSATLRFNDAASQQTVLSVVADLGVVPTYVVAEFMAALDELNRAKGGAGLTITSDYVGVSEGVEAGVVR